MNAKKYINLLEDYLISFIEETHENVILQQDNAAIHSAKKTQECRFRLKNLLLMKWQIFRHFR